MVSKIEKILIGLSGDQSYKYFVLCNHSVAEWNSSFLLISWFILKLSNMNFTIHGFHIFYSNVAPGIASCPPIIRGSAPEKCQVLLRYWDIFVYFPKELDAADAFNAIPFFLDQK
jgi:hypothetical protein